MEQAISMQDIAQAAERIRPYIKKTPLMRAEKLEALFGGAEIWLKLENFQITGSFKLRGVANKVCTLTEEELKRGGYRRLQRQPRPGGELYGRPAGGPRPPSSCRRTPPQAKVDGARGFGAEVILHGFTGEDRDQKCEELIARYGYSLIHSHTDPAVIAGHATAATEALEQMEGKVDAVVIPCGAGSLTSGAARAVKGLNPENRHHRGGARPPCPASTQSLAAGHPVTVEMGQTIADGLRVSKAEPINYELIRDNVDTLLTIEENWIEQAVREMAFRAKVVAEPSGCVGIAAALAGKIDTSAGKRLIFLITGGNVDGEFYATLLRGRG